MFKYPPTIPRFAKPIVRPDEVPTQNGLAFDLKDMDELIERGIPVSSNSLSQSFYDGEVTDSFDMPYENKRGVDLNDVWNFSKDAHEKITKSKLKLTDVNPK